MSVVDFRNYVTCNSSGKCAQNVLLIIGSYGYHFCRKIDLELLTINFNPIFVKSGDLYELD